MRFQHLCANVAKKYLLPGDKVRSLSNVFTTVNGWKSTPYGLFVRVNTKSLQQRCFSHNDWIKI